MGDGRHQNPGPKPKLDDVCCANLLQALRGPAPDGGLWNGRIVADYLSELIGQPISRQQGWEYLLQMRQRLRVPRQPHQEADPEEQEAWKKKLTQELKRIQAEHPDADVEVWCEDEHRIGLQPVNRRIWVEEGSQPVAIVNWKREWLWLYAFVQPQTGETYWWILKRSRRTEYSDRHSRAPMSILSYSVGYSRILLNTLGWVRASVLSCRWTKLGGT